MIDQMPMTCQGTGVSLGVLDMRDARRLVLVADDDRAVRESLKFALELEGFEVRVFANGRDLLNDPQFLVAGCVVIDHDMPAMGGFEVLALANASRARLPAILMTVHASEAMRRHAKNVGVQYVVEKPLMNGTLMENIQAVLSRT